METEDTNNSELQEQTKETADKIMQNVIGYGLYDFCKKPILLHRRSWILRLLKEKIDKAKKIFSHKPKINEILSQQIVKPAKTSSWAVFEAVVCSVEHVTQRAGKNDYCLLYYDGEKKILFIAREILLGLPSINLIAEFLFSELGKGCLSLKEIRDLFVENYTSDACGQNNGYLNDLVRQLLKRRAVPYQLEGLIEDILNRVVEIIFCKRTGENYSQERDRYYNSRIRDEIDLILRKNPRNLREGFTKPIKKLKSFITYEELYEILGKMGVWRTKLHLLLKEIRRNLAQGDLEEFFYKNADYLVISHYLYSLEADQTKQDRWLDEEIELLWREFNQFLEQVRSHSQKVFDEFTTYIEQARIINDKSLTATIPQTATILQSARVMRENLESLRDAFSLDIENIFDVDTKELIAELSAKITEMDVQYKSLVNNN